MIYAAYYDESDEKPGFSLAGYSAAYDTWLHLGWKWEDLLKKWNLEYFKASECENGLGEFAQYRDVPGDQRSSLKSHEREKLKEIKTQFVDAITKHHDDLQGYGAVVIVEDFEKIISEDDKARRYLGDKPYYICFSLCLLEAAMPVREANSRRSKDIQISVKPFFDSHEEYSGLAKAHFAGFIKKNPRAAEVLLPPTYEDDITTMPLQVADTLAYETRKVLARQIKNPVDDYMRVPMQRLLPAIYRVYRLDYEALKTIVRMQVADSVAIPHKKIDELC